MITLGIESSCDETGVSIIKDGKILSNEVASSLKFHEEFGGIVPEIATRYHCEIIDKVFKKALDKAGTTKGSIDLVAFTYGPGLAGSLLVGVSFAKALSFSLKVPMVGVNHLHAHAFSALLGANARSIKFPFISLIISGGHTNLALVRDYNKFELLSQTQDDAVGEAFDKVSKILGFGYPGGPIIERLAKKGRPDNVNLMFSNRDNASLKLSFSGLKTAVLYYVRDTLKRNKKLNAFDIAGKFQETVIKLLFEKLKLAYKIKNARTLVVSGGVAINNSLRNYFIKNAKPHKLKIIFPKNNLCTDNAAMVALFGEVLFKKKKITCDSYISATSNLGLDSYYNSD